MNLRGNIFLLTVIAFLATSCAARETPITPTPIAAILPTLTPQPSTTPTPGPSTTPAPTPEPPLKTDGPYLAYFRYVDKQEKYVDGDQELVLMDADGVGRKVIFLPSKNHADTHFLSPDGKWLAYYSGSAKKDKSSDLTLNLLDLENGESRLVSKLLSKDYPDNFIQAAKDLNNPYINADILKETFITGITSSLGWSPDGRYLAFAGQMDGRSSDVYLYDLAKGNIRRMTHGPDEVEEISWSPNGNWILSSGETRLGEGGGFNEDAIAFDSFKIISLPYRNYGVVRAWYNDHTYVDYDNQNVVGNTNLRSVDIETGKVVKIWEGAFRNFVFDPEKALVFLFTWTRTWPPKPDEGLPGGPYLISIRDGKKTKLDQDCLNTYLFGLGNRRFLTKYDNNAYFISTDGTLLPASPEIDNVSVAPNKQHWISIGKTLKVFNADDKILYELPSPLGEKDFPLVTWSPDSSGFFIAIDRKLYALDVPHGKISLVETSLSPNWGLPFTWVGKQ